VASRTARDPQGFDWTIRERWVPVIGGLPPNAAADAFDGGAYAGPLALLLLPFGLLFSLVSWLARFPLALFTALFLPPWIDAARENGPPIRMTWRARDRQVGPRVLDELAARIARGELGTQVEGAEFEGFGR
jgi:hypothetical protein